ncbi:response regulator, partial [Hungatella effluvii]
MEKQKILIVDDSEMNRDLLIDILEDQYDIVEAENGAEAVAILLQQRTDFSLLLLDIMMPQMDGFEVLTCINKNHWNDTFAVIMISADDSPANIKRAYDLGAFDYISRP